MCGYREVGFAPHLLFYRLDNVVGHEGFPIVLSDMPVRHEAGLAAQVAGELAAVGVLHNNRVPRALEDVDNRVAVERDEPADFELIGGNALLGEELAGLLDQSLGRFPPGQTDIVLTRAPP